MATITTRAGKGSPLTHAEVDANFTNINTEASAALPKAGGTMTGNINHGDNVKAQYGAGNDLQIYHDGGTSFIEDAGTGNLHIKTNGAEIDLFGGSDYMIRAFKDGAVSLFYDNSEKFATASTGVNVTGSLDVTDAATTRTNLDVDQAGEALALAIALG